MIIDKRFMDELSVKAYNSPRMGTNYDLRNSEDDQSQRMLNVLEPVIQMTIYRHPDTIETICMLRGSIKESFHDDNGTEVGSHMLRAGSDCLAMVIPSGTWHELEYLESGSVLLTVRWAL